MNLGWKVLRASVCMLGVFVGELAAIEHDCEKELVPIVDPSITGLGFQSVVLYEHSDSTGLQVRVANRTSKRIIGFYTAFEAYSRSGEYLVAFSGIALSSDHYAHKALATTDPPEGLEPGHTSLTKSFYPGTTAALIADSSQSLVTCGVNLRVRRLWLEFEDGTIQAVQGRGWNSDALPKDSSAIHGVLPQRCRNQIVALEIAQDGKATVKSSNSECVELRDLLESLEFTPARRGGRAITKVYRVLFRDNDSDNGLSKKDFGSEESMVVMVASKEECRQGISLSWGNNLFLIPDTVVDQPECPGPPSLSRTSGPH